MRLSHPTARARALFDDPHPVSYAGRVPVEALAERAGRGGLAAGHVRPRGHCGAGGYRLGALVARPAARIILFSLVPPVQLTPYVARRA